MKLDDIPNYRPEDWPYRAVTNRGEFHVFKSRSQKRRWQKRNGVVGHNNPLHVAQAILGEAP